MSNTNSIMDFSAQELFEQLKSTKKELISKKKIMDKKDKHIYPISKIPFSIPETWEWTYLSDISIIQEGPGIRKHQYADDGVQFLTVTNILEGSVDLEKSKKYISNDEYENKYSHFKINKGDIVTACSGGSWGKSAIFECDDKLILNTSTLRLRFFNDIGCNKYLYYLTKTDFFKKSLSSYSTGQQPNYGYYHYSRIPIPLPSLSEQQKIVSVIDRAYEAIEKALYNAEKNLNNAKELFESYLQGVFENKGDDWEDKRLDEVCVKTETVNPKLKPENEFIYIDVSSVNKETKIIEETTKLIGRDAPSRARKLVKTNDVIFATVRPTHSRVALISEKYNNQVCSTGYYVLRANEEINSSIIYYFLLTYTFNKKMEKLQKGASYPAVTNKEVESQIISFPKTFEEQKQIIERLDNLSDETKKLEAIYRQKINDLEELKKSVLQRAFAGELSTTSSVTKTKEIAL